MEWREQAACRGMNTALWFATKDAKAMESAKHICASCVVKTQCEDYGKRTKAEGIWGGRIIGSYSSGRWIPRRHAEAS